MPDDSRKPWTQGAPPPYGMNPQPAYGVNPQPAYGMNPIPQVTPTVIVQAPMLGSAPCNLQCPSCHASVQTRVDYEPNTKTHLFALLLCLICCPCALIPYCTDSCKSANHYCPSCGTFLGTYSD
ncbi:lipopolysaccharide-induced tumor necrosis factor-alpha factor-like isoform X2 [Zootermopsis nevadensis]|uniref:lipopolysaccharide-induced tumor necrosis factor-alpha factor-like isoform X2 n=1 Tax=Zootermopsis nevadensis TaxID=136037 RepID=UPI000B8E71FC|nr:lipopolysaccharide-induced tumor necrosis factor-alpha factor-like isoform X2 [Zootermopsis nevadensis]